MISHLACISGYSHFVSFWDSRDFTLKTLLKVNIPTYADRYLSNYYLIYIENISTKLSHHMVMRGTPFHLWIVHYTINNDTSSPYCVYHYGNHTQAIACQQ